MLRSDAESVSTTISQDSRGSNKENRPRHQEEVIHRPRPEYNRVSAIDITHLLT